MDRTVLRRFRFKMAFWRQVCAFFRLSLFCKYVFCLLIIVDSYKKNVSGVL